MPPKAESNILVQHWMRKSRAVGVVKTLTSRYNPGIDDDNVLTVLEENVDVPVLFFALGTRAHWNQKPLIPTFQKHKWVCLGAKRNPAHAAWGPALTLWYRKLHRGLSPEKPKVPNWYTRYPGYGASPGFDSNSDCSSCGLVYGKEDPPCMGIYVDPPERIRASKDWARIAEVEGTEVWVNSPTFVEPNLKLLVETMDVD